MVANTLLFTTICRASAIDEPSGYVYTLDLDPQRITGRSPVIEPLHLRHNQNPRGGLRGARGFAVVKDSVCIANCSTIHCFDGAWRLIGSLSHPSCADIHDILGQEDRLWVTSTRSDLVFEFDLAGTVHRCINLKSFRELGTTL